MDPDAVDSLRKGSEEGGVSHDVDGTGHVHHGGTDDPWLLDFSANTNPVVPDGAPRVYESAFAASRTYPAESYCEFRVAGADHVGCQPRSVVPTAGGLAAIRLAIQSTVSAGDSVLVPKPSFGEYAREVRLQGGEPVFRPHDEILAADPDEHAMAIVCHPNNPTGDAYHHIALGQFAERCRAADTPVLVDEAFLGFTDLPSFSGTDGVIVARSLTKLFGLPGLRAGFAVATGNLRDRLETAAMPWSIGTPVAAVGAHCLGQTEFVETTRERVSRERARLRAYLEDRYRVYPSDAPFLLVDVGSADAVDSLLEHFRVRDIVVRDARTFRGLDSHVRIAVRSPDDNDQLIDALPR